MSAVSTVSSFATSIASGMAGPLDRQLAYEGNFIFPNAKLDMETYVKLYFKDIIDRSTLLDQTKQLGFNVEGVTGRTSLIFQRTKEGKCERKLAEDFEGMNAVSLGLLFNKHLPSPDETLLMLNRELITSRCADFLLHLQFDGELAISDAFKELRFEIPGPSDLISFAVREAFDPLTIQAFGYHKEIPNQIIPWMEKQGYGGQVADALPPGATDNFGNALVRPVYWFDMYWFAHWQLPSPTQGFEMLHRLYPFSDYGPSPSIRNGVTFTEQQMGMLLKTQDYPQFWRDRLTLISYSPLTRVDVRRMFEMDVLGEADVYHAYRQLGYDDLNAKHLLNFSKEKKRLATYKKLKHIAEKPILELLSNGVISFKEAHHRLKLLGYTPEDAEAVLLEHEFFVERNYVVRYKEQIKKAFLRGLINISEANQSLANLGISGPNVAKDLQLWQMMLYSGGKHIESYKAIQLYIKGLLPLPSLLIRLTNLGYTQEEVSLLVIEANQYISMQQDKQQQKLLKETQRKLTTAARQQLAAYTDKNIIAFYQGGFITEETIRLILDQRGWDDKAIDAWIAINIVP